MHQGRPGPAGVKSETGWTKMGPLGATFALGAFLYAFTHFYEGPANNCALFLRNNENTRKIKQIALKFMNIAQKHRKSH